MKSSRDIEKLFKDLNDTTNAEMDERVLRNMSQALEKLNRPNIWRIIMKSSITKLAIAAVIIVITFIGLQHFTGSSDFTTPVFADIVKPLLTAQSGTFKMTIDVVKAGLDWINCGNQPQQTIDVIYAGQAKTRWNVPTGEVLIANMQQGKVMILMPAKKTAAVMEVCPPGTIPPHNRFNKLFELQPLIRYALDTNDISVQYLGTQKIKGVTVVGYLMTGPQHHGDITIWADLKTKLPIQIEQTMKMKGRTENVIINEITYNNVEPKESLFAIEPPTGYSVVVPGSDEPKFEITGTVTDAAGQPIKGATVSDDGYGSNRNTITDSNGRYSYLTWPEKHRIKAEAPGYKTQRKALTTGLFHTENVEQKEIINFVLERE